VKGDAYFDTSAWFKRYFKEKGTEKVLALMEESEKVCLCDVGIPELFAILRRQVRDGLLSESQYAAVKKAVGQDLKEVSVFPLDAATVNEAIHCLENAVLRGFDSIHVASARIHRCGLFVSADKKQCRAARKLGLRVMEIG